MPCQANLLHLEVLFRQQFRRDLRAERFTMEFAQSAPMALQSIEATAVFGKSHNGAIDGLSRFFRNAAIYGGEAQLWVLVVWKRPGAAPQGR